MSALAGLTTRHARLEEALDKLERLCRKPPDRRCLADARLGLSRASAERTRFLAEDIFPALLAPGNPSVAETVRRLRIDGAHIRATSAEHVASWSLDRAIADWPSYCRASEAMRTTMRARLRQERHALYPLLD
jgi:hypothetical protein